MKKRNCFIANSSSSSFVLDKSKISAIQLEAVLNHLEYAKRHFNVVSYDNYENKGFWCDVEDGWVLDNSGEPFLAGYTWMDNFDMEKFFEKLDIPKDAYAFN